MSQEHELRAISERLENERAMSEVRKRLRYNGNIDCKLNEFIERVVAGGASSSAHRSREQRDGGA